MNKKLLWGAGVVVVVVLAGWQANKGSQNTGTIKIGAVLGLTGPASTWSEYAKKAADLAVKEINDGGGVRGKRLEIVYEDGKTSPASDVSAFQKLITVDSVPAVIGDVWSFITNPMIPIAGDHKVVLISPTVMDKSVEGGNAYFYTLGHTVDSQRKAVRRFLELHEGSKTAAIFCWNDAWGQAHRQLFKEVLQDKGIKIVYDECTADYSSDYRTSIAEVKSIHPDLLLVTTSLPVNFLKARRNLGVTAPTLLTNVVIDALEVQHLSRENALGVYFTDWLPNGDFIQKFRSAYGVYPIMESQNSYEAVRSIAKALENNGADILGGLHRVKYEGVDGPIDFTTSDHNRINNAEAKLFQVEENEYRPIN